MEQFNSMVTNKLGAYVYALASPLIEGDLSKRIFYIGKGNGNRCFNHARAERGHGDALLREDEHKLDAIRKIHKKGREVDVVILKHDMSDAEAFALEAVLIPLVGETNKIAGQGHDRLWLTKPQINELYDKPIQRADIGLFRTNVLFVSLNQQDLEALRDPKSEDEMATATLGDWGINEVASKTVDCVVGVKHGLIVSIFETRKDCRGVTVFKRFKSQKPRGHGRSRFEGKRVKSLENELVNRSVIENGTQLSKIRPGAGCQFVAAM